MKSMFKILSGTTLACASVAASAHHAMDGAMPDTFAQGLISGLAHPIIGLDHLAFIVAAAWLIAKLPAATRSALAAVFVAGSILGTVLHVNLLDLPGSELLVALSVLVAGVLVWTGKLQSASALWMILPIAGVFHGYAYGESIVGAENTALYAYLLGFALIQWLVMTGISAALNKLRTTQFSRSAIAAGVAVTAVGLWFSISQTAGMLAA
ncbi:HupE/UreJ family protein [Diaphorobacter caeni]|uniref:HupE/UreJ family protein n=1 Tax=Diaphorobacter caeni TaxID=2784387 RepID=UPI00188E7B96|nr:HupE/UreJ family protein [Diaphorobacter caeni]MBF5005218.1 HupE/UreJ family protein [Diaphorobacter caeni]